MILAIESSCDDSSVALMREDFTLAFYEKVTQEEIHSTFGGVVPELAARLHTQALPQILARAREFFPQVKAIAVTNAPGLSVSLISGVSAAKALSIALGVPLVAVNHLLGHIYSLFLESEVRLPLGVLLVSGGHTMVLRLDTKGQICVLAKTGDDSFGESFDKVAKMLSLGYPGGAVVEREALAFEESGASKGLKFTVPLKGDKRLEYSFSGLKNQVRLAVESGEFSRGEICAAFQKAAILHILDKLERVFESERFENFGVVGGASANLVLRSKLTKLCDKFGSRLLFAPLKFCSDNAAMIARAGIAKFRRGETCSHEELLISPKSDLNGVCVL